MKYRDILGYDKEKTPTKKQSKPKKNRILEGIKKDLNEWTDTTFRDKPKRWSGSGLTEFEKQGGKDTLKEMTSAQEHYKYIKLITKAEENMHKHIQEYKYFLQDQDLDREAKEIGSKYITMTGKFTHYLKTKWVKMVRKMI